MKKRQKKQAVEQIDAYAQFKLGSMYAEGLRVEQDYTKAVYWYRKAAERGNADARLNLADFYKKGLGVEQDYAKAVYWYRKDDMFLIVGEYDTLV